jgi:hypothetical protein
MWGLESGRIRCRSSTETYHENENICVCIRKWKESQQQKRQCRMWKHQDSCCSVGILHSSQQLSASFVLSEVKAYPPDCRSCLGLHARPSFLGFIRGSVRSVIFCGHQRPPQRVVCLLLTFPNPQHIAHTPNKNTYSSLEHSHSRFFPPPFTPFPRQ